MKHSLLVNLLLLCLLLALSPFAECFLIHGRHSHRFTAANPSSFTARLATKHLTFKTSNGTVIRQRFTSNKSLQSFLDEQDVFYLVDDSSNELLPRPNLKYIKDGATFSMVVEWANLPDDSVMPMSTKTITIQDAAGNKDVVEVNSQQKYEAILAIQNTTHLIDHRGYFIYFFDLLEDGATYFEPEPKLEQLPSHPYPLKTLPRPKDVPLAPASHFTPFVCEDEWIEDILSHIERQYTMTDNGYRVRPLALVRCYQGGKTRAIHEIAQRVKTLSSRFPDVAVVIVSFTQHSPLMPFDQANPLQGFLSRLVFELQWTKEDGEKDSAYEDFSMKGYTFDPDDMDEWLGDCPMIVFVDGLDSLQELKVGGSSKALEFGQFIKRTFLKRQNRHFIFTSHIFDTVEHFEDCADAPGHSGRTVLRFMLPYVNSLAAAQKLDPTLQGIRQAIYYGLIPGLIVDQRPDGSEAAGGKHEIAVEEYDTLVSTNPEQAFKNLLLSFITGEIGLIPASLHALLDPKRAVDSSKVCWVLFHLEHVVRLVTLPRGGWMKEAALTLSKLCSGFKHASPNSGQDWEFAFTLVTLVRCIAGAPDGYFLPHRWFNSPELEIKYNPYRDPHWEKRVAKGQPRSLDKCTEWAHLEAGLQVGDGPTIVIFDPPHASFATYDLIVLFMDKKEIKESRGFQLKTGRGVPSSGSSPAERVRFLVTGAPNESTKYVGWDVPEESVINDFFGESGRIMTPKEMLRVSGGV